MNTALCRIVKCMIGAASAFMTVAAMTLLSCIIYVGEGTSLQMIIATTSCCVGGAITAIILLVWETANCLSVTYSPANLRQTENSTSSFLHRFDTRKHSRKTHRHYLNGFSMSGKITGDGGRSTNKENN